MSQCQDLLVSTTESRVVATRNIWIRGVGILKSFALVLQRIPSTKTPQPLRSLWHLRSDGLSKPPITSSMIQWLSHLDAFLKSFFERTPNVWLEFFAACFWSCLIMIHGIISRRHAQFLFFFDVFGYPQTFSSSHLGTGILSSGFCLYVA